MLSEDLLAECKDKMKDCEIFLYRQPNSCQAKKILCIGWLMGSVKSMREDTLKAAIRNVLSIPLHVALGITWRVLKNKNKKQYNWGTDHNT